MQLPRGARSRVAPRLFHTTPYAVIEMTQLIWYVPSGRLFALAAVAALASLGCSGKGIKKVTVNGTVSHKGQKLQSGILKFVGPEGSYSAAEIQPDGTYIMTDVVPGEIKVAVVQGPQSSGDSSGKGPARPPTPQAEILAKYQDPETSGVTYTVTDSTSKLDIAFP